MRRIMPLDGFIFLETGKQIADREHTILGFAVDNCKPAGRSLALILNLVKEE